MAFHSHKILILITYNFDGDRVVKESHVMMCPEELYYIYLFIKTK